MIWSKPEEAEYFHDSDSRCTTNKSYTTDYLSISLFVQTYSMCKRMHPRLYRKMKFRACSEWFKYRDVIMQDTTSWPT